MELIDRFLGLSWKEKSVTLYVIALFTPMFFGAWPLIGIFGILIGWIGLIEFNLFIGLPWIANVLYFIILISKKLNLKIKLILSILMVMFGLFAIGITEVPRDEGGGNYDVTVGIGFGLWVLSFIFLILEQIKLIKDKNVG
ncbi:MAG: hypothetical protein KDD32_10350 [Bacteroidetes bacterium]|nr:hypothetical protein [Bacteroidota bacterium]